MNNKIEKVEFQLTTSCNMSCAFCCHGEEISSDKVDLDSEIVCKTIRELASHTKLGSPYVDIKSIWLTGGEALLSMDSLIKIIKECNSLNIVSGLTTNGLLLEESLPQLIASGLNEVRISMDSIRPHVFEKLRGKQGAFSTVLKNIELSVKSGLKTSIRITITDENVDEISDIVKLMSGLAVSKIEIKSVIPVGRADFGFMAEHKAIEKAFNAAVAALPSEQNKTTITMMCNYLPQCKGFNISPNVPCVCSYSALYVATDGTIIPCGYFPKKSNYNIYRDSIFKAWNSYFFESVRDNKPSKCKICSHWDSCKNGCPAIFYSIEKFNHCCFDGITEQLGKLKQSGPASRDIQ